MTAHDNDLLNRINRLLDDGQATGDDLLDHLANAVPQAAAGFQNRLEEQLMAKHIATNTDERTSSMSLNGYLSDDSTLPQSPKARPVVHIPFTLAAMLLVVLLGGGLILTMQSNTPQNAVPAYVPQATPEIPTNLQPVVIALRDIRSRMYIAAEWLAVVYWPADLVPDGAYTSIESLQNTVTTHNVAQYQPLTAADSTALTDDTTIVVEIPRARLQSVAMGVQPGTIVHILDGSTQITTQAQVIEVSSTRDMLVVLVPAQDAVAMSDLLVSNRIITVAIERASGTPGNDESSLATQTIPDGYVAIAVPLDSFAPTFQLDEGHWVEIWATIVLITNTEDPDFQRPEVVTQQIIPLAQIIYVYADSGIITLAVTPQDATILTWLVEARIPMTLMQAQTSADSTSEYPNSTPLNDKAESQSIP